MVQLQKNLGPLYVLVWTEDLEDFDHWILNFSWEYDYVTAFIDN